MNKEAIKAFFDRHAHSWDAGAGPDERKIKTILDAGDIKEGAAVLDVACGTGVLFPHYVERKAARITGVDISPEMIRIASAKIKDPRIEAICGDIETIPISRTYDRIVVFNAFPHFEDPVRLVNRLAGWAEPGARLTVAHSMGIKELARHHEGEARCVSRAMLSAEELAMVFADCFRVDIALSEDDIYIVSGVKK